MVVFVIIFVFTLTIVLSVCQYGCGRSFIQKCNRTRHHRIHSGERPYLCPVTDCGRRFNRKFGLATHLKNIHQILIQSGVTAISASTSTSVAAVAASQQLQYELDLREGGGSIGKYGELEVEAEEEDEEEESERSKKRTST